MAGPEEPHILTMSQYLPDQGGKPFTFEEERIDIVNGEEPRLALPLTEF